MHSRWAASTGTVVQHPQQRESSASPRSSDRPKPAKGVAGDRVVRRVSIVAYVGLLVVCVVAVDILFFRNRFWERLLANVGIVLVFAAFALRFLRKP